MTKTKEDEIERLRAVITNAVDRLSPLGERHERYLRYDLAVAIGYNPLQCNECNESTTAECSDNVDGKVVCEGCL